MFLQVTTGLDLLPQILCCNMYAMREHVCYVMGVLCVIFLYA